MKRILSLLAALALLLTCLYAAAKEVWVPGEAPAVRNSMDEADCLALHNQRIQLRR